MNCLNFLQNHCLSCDQLSYGYLSSISIKEKKIRDLFPDHLNKIKETMKCDKGAEGSRNKAKLAVAMVHNEIEFGFYNKKMEFKKLEDCPLHAPAINAVLPILKRELNNFKIVPYDLTAKKGELKYILITYSESADELLLRFVMRSTESLARLKKLTLKLMAENPVIKVITANIQSTHQAILEGNEEIVLSEKDYITHHFDDYYLYQGPRSFFQTNSEIALKLYRQFQNELGKLRIQSLLDLYCGVGAFSFYSEQTCTKVEGVEISDAAIYYANKAHEKNRSNNIHFSVMDVESYLKDQRKGSYDAILVNPPRRGLNDTIISHLLRLAPAYLFYSSCNEETLHRDILKLNSQYQIQSLQIFDMFPFTSHFETLAVLSYTN